MTKVVRERLCVLALALLVAHEGHGGSFVIPPLLIPPVPIAWAPDGPEVEALVTRLRNDDLKWESTHLGLAVALQSTVAQRLLFYPQAAVNRALFSALSHPGRFAVAHVLLTQRSGISFSTSASEWNGLHIALLPAGSVKLDAAQRPQLQAFWRGTLGY